MNELFESVPIMLIAPFVVLELILKVTALISCLKQQETKGPKLMWVLLILFVSTIGPILYFVVGRKSAHDAA